MLVFGMSLLKLLEGRLLEMHQEKLMSALRFDPETEEYPLYDVDPELIFRTYKYYMNHGIVNRILILTGEYEAKRNN